MNQTRPIKVIIFEDDCDMARLLETVISSLGFEVSTYSDPLLCPVYREPKCTCPMDSPCADIVITDYRMPNMTGTELLQLQDARGCKTKLENKAIVSASVSTLEKDNLASLGCHYISKPFRIAEVKQWVEECAARIRASRRPALSRQPVANSRC